MNINRLDHIVLTVKDIETTVDFYVRVLGMVPVSFAGGRRALAYGNQKINLHEYGKEFEPKASNVQVGSADLCFITNTPVTDALAHAENEGVNIIEGPVTRTGAKGQILSIYFNDPDGNLLEVSNYLNVSEETDQGDSESI